MAKTLHKLSDEDMQALADKLIGLKVNKARAQVRRLDPDSEMQMYRVGVGHEILTRFNLPNLGVSVTLVEVPRVTPKGGDSNTLKAEPAFVEARIAAL